MERADSTRQRAQVGETARIGIILRGCDFEDADGTRAGRVTLDDEELVSDF